MHSFPQLNLPLDLAEELEGVYADLKHLQPVATRPLEMEPISKGPDLPENVPNVLSIQGWPQAGKDVIADRYINNYGGVGRLAFSDAIIKEINGYLTGSGHEIGPDNKSHRVYRKLLQVWARARRVENPHYWSEPVKQGLRALQDAGAQLAIATGMRTELERDAILGIEGGEVWRVIRPKNPYQSDDLIEHALDHIPNYEWHAVIINDTEGNLTPLNLVVDEVIRSSERGFCHKDSAVNVWHASGQSQKQRGNVR